MIKINDDVRRILRLLLSTNGKIEMEYDGYITKIIYLGYRIDFAITKCEDDKEYFIEFLDSEKEGKYICFTTQSSVINFLKNNVLK